MIYLINLFIASLIVSIIIVTYIRTDNDIESLPGIDIDDLNTIDKIQNLGFFGLILLIVFLSLVLPFILIHMLYEKLTNPKS